MFEFERLTWSRATIMRMAADLVMVNASLAAALLARYVAEVGLIGAGAPQSVLQEYVSDFTRSCGLLSVLALAVFYLSGFYTRGRFYRGRYKALVIVQALSLSYLLFGFCVFLSQGFVSVPRTAIFLGWGLTLGCLLLSRLWTSMWEQVSTHQASPARTASVSADRPRRTLVIGGAGYIGSALLPKLLEQGRHVRLLDLFLFGHQPIAKVLGHPNLEIVRSDFRHLDKVLRATRDVETVIHLGGIVGDPACSIDEALTVEVNLIATRMIAEVAKGNGVRRLCFASSCSVYGASDEQLDERSTLNPISLYAKSKLASEQVLLQLADSAFSPVILRFGTVYGFSGRTRFDLVINLLTAKAVTERKITVFGGNQWRPFLHVDDAALAITRAVEAPLDLVHGQVFNVGSNEQNFQLGEAAQLIQRLNPASEVVEMGAGSDFRNYRVDFTKIAHRLGFRPKWSLEDGVRQVMAAFAAGQVSDYRLPIYNNAKYLSEGPTTQRIRPETGWAEELIKQDVPSGTGTRPVITR